MQEKVSLFPRQKETLRKALDYIEGKERRPGVIVAPTAYGKSFVISAIANEVGSPVLVLQPSKELLEQNYEKLLLLGGEAAIFSASLNSKEVDKLTYATLGSIKDKADIFKKLGVKIVLIDECDAGYPPDKGKRFRKFIDKLAPDKVIGLTATPFRMKNTFDVNTRESVSRLVMLNRMRPMYFKHFIDVIQIQEMTEQNRWCKLHYTKYTFNQESLRLNSTGSEFTDSSMKKAIQEQGINNSIYSRVVDLLEDPNERVLVFCDSVETAEKLASCIPDTEALSDKTTNKERERIVREFRENKIRAVFNYGVLSVGFDYQELNRIIWGRPTNSLRLYYQVNGRGVRIHPDKEVCYIEDFCGNVDRFGRVEDITIENFPGYGWGVFSGDILLTDHPMGYPRITKQKLSQKDDTPVEKLWFGKNKGKRLDELSLHNLKWYSDWIDNLDNPSNKLRGLKLSIESILENNNLL